MNKKACKIFIIFILFAACSINSQGKKDRIKFAAHWMPQAQFAGYYMGIEKGIYEKYGLELEILHANPNVTAQDLLIEGKVDFASMFLSTAVSLRSFGYSLVNVFQLSQRCSQVLVSRKADLIDKPAAYNGKKIGVWRSGFSEVNTAFIEKYDLQVDIVPISSTVNLFLSGGIDVMLTMWYNEYHTILNSGLNEEELNILFFSDYGLNLLEDGIYCMQSVYDEDKTIRFIEATKEAWEYAFNHPEESLDAVIKRMHESFIPANRAHQKWMLNRMKDLFSDSNSGKIIGVLSEDDFRSAMDILSGLDKIKNKYSFKEFYYGN